MAIEAVDWAMFSWFLIFIILLEEGENHPGFMMLAGVAGLFLGWEIFVLTSEGVLTLLVMVMSLFLFIFGATRRYHNEDSA